MGVLSCSYKLKIMSIKRIVTTCNLFRHDSGCFSAQHSPKSTDGLDSSVPFNVTDDGRVRKWQNDVCQESYLNMLAQDAPERWVNLLFVRLIKCF